MGAGATQTLTLLLPFCLLSYACWLFATRTTTAAATHEVGALLGAGGGRLTRLDEAQLGLDEDEGGALPDEDVGLDLLDHLLGVHDGEPQADEPLGEDAEGHLQHDAQQTLAAVCVCVCVCVY